MSSLSGPAKKMNNIGVTSTAFAVTLYDTRSVPQDVIFLKLCFTIILSVLNKLLLLSFLFLPLQHPPQQPYYRPSSLKGKNLPPLKKPALPNKKPTRQTNLK